MLHRRMEFDHLVLDLSGTFGLTFKNAARSPGGSGGRAAHEPW
jgi:hypothetical protein